MYIVFSVNEILGSVVKERSTESPNSTEDSKTGKGVFLKPFKGDVEMLELLSTLHIQCPSFHGIDLLFHFKICFCFSLIFAVLLQFLQFSKDHRLKSCGNLAKNSG